jgi:hypothetical protein
MAVKVGFNRKRVGIKTPAGNKATATTATGSYSAVEKVQTHLSFGVDGANAVPSTSLRGDPFSVSRTGVGTYVVLLGGASDLAGGYGVRKTITAVATLQTATVGSLVAEVAAVDDAAGSYTIKVTNKATGAYANPAAAGTNERIHLVVTFDNGAM